MSGGHWEYNGYNTVLGLQEIACDPEVMRRWPNLATLFNSLAHILYRAEHDMDWDLSGDTSIPNDKQFEEEIIGEILKQTIKNAQQSAVQNALSKFKCL